MNENFKFNISMSKKLSKNCFFSPLRQHLRRSPYNSIQKKRSPLSYKSVSPRVRYMNSQPNVNQKNPMIQKVRERKNNTERKPAGEVIHDYIIPMIESNSVHRFRALSPNKPQLSKDLLQQIKEAQDELVITQNSQLALDKELAMNLKSLKKLKNKVAEALVSLQYCSSKNYSKEPKSKEWGEIKFVASKALCYEFQLRDELFAKISRLQHDNFLLNLHHHIMSDRLANMVYIISRIKHVSRSGITELIHEFAPAASYLDTHHQNQGIVLSLIKELSSLLAKKSYEITHEHISISKNMKKIKKHSANTLKVCKKQMYSLRANISNKRKTIDSLEQKINELGIHYEILAAEFNQRLKESTGTEKICTQCKTMFFENQNFNWSCNVHASDWSGSFYWCCGSTSLNSLGCVKNKHVAEDIVFSHGENKNTEVCISCKEEGHSAKDCPKDPNTCRKTNYQELKQMKRLSQSPTYESRTNVFSRDSENNDDEDLDVIKEEGSVYYWKFKTRHMQRSRPRHNIFNISNNHIFL